MGRSSKLQAAENRQLIVEKASELFRAHGIADVSVSDVMKAAGMTIGGFYKHFDSKEALAEEAARLAFETSSRGWREIGNQDPVSAHMNIARHYFVPKEATKRCPMMSFGGDLMKHTQPGLNSDSTEGIKTLLSAFCSSEEVNAPDNQKLLQFAAMVGANYLSEVMDDKELSERLKAAVLEIM